MHNDLKGYSSVRVNTIPGRIAKNRYGHYSILYDAILELTFYCLTIGVSETSFLRE